MSKISQKDLLFEYFKKNPKKNISHREIVGWALREFLKRTGRVFADPDRGIRTLHQEGFLIKVGKGIYRYDPSKVKKRKLEDFSAKTKKAVLEKDGYKCVICGQGKKEGVELHVDHIKPKDFGGRATMENGQTLCSRHNFLKKNFKQTETGKKLFIHLYDLAKKEDDVELTKFCKDILRTFEKHNINGHIEWKK